MSWSWRWLVAGIVATTLIPIGIHTVLLDDLGVPYPSAFPRRGWAALPDRALLALGVIMFAGYLRAAYARWGLVARLAIVFLLTAAINQALAREAIMRNVVSTRWTIYPFIDNLPVVLTFALVAVLAVLSEPWLTTWPRRIGGALAIAWLAFRMASPRLDAAFAGVVAANASREGDQRYSVPYDWHVDVPSYMTFIEPALAAVALAMLLRALPWSAARRAGITAATIFLVQGGPLFRPFLNILYAPTGAAMAMLSVGQFTFEAMALALLAALAVAYASRDAARSDTLGLRQGDTR